MPLNDINIKNFKLDSFIVTDSTDLQTYHELWQQGHPDGIAGNMNSAGQSNTLPRAVLIELSVSGSTANPNGGTSGYWSFGTKDLKIGDCTTWGINNPDCVENSEGIESGKWLTYVNYTDPPGAYYTHAACPLKNMEFDPGGGCHPNYWSSSGHYPTGYTKIGHDFWKSKLQGEYMGEPYEPTIGEPVTYFRHWSQDHNPIVSGFLWDDVVKHVTAVNSMPLNSDGSAQQGNKVYCIVTLKAGVTGQDIIDLGGVVRVNFNGSPNFVSTTTTGFTTDTDNNTWNDNDISNYTDETVYPSADNNTDSDDIGFDDGEDVIGVLDGDIGLISDSDFTFEAVDSGVEDSDIDDYLGEDTTTADVIADDNPNIPDETLSDVSVPNATEYDSAANTIANDSTEDDSATTSAGNSGLQNESAAQLW